MANSEFQILSGDLSLDKNGERLFLSTFSETKVNFAGKEIIGNHVFRILEGKSKIFESGIEIFSTRGITVSIVARIATQEELSEHDQLTDPTFTTDKIVTFKEIQKRAYQIFVSNPGNSAVDNWLSAEKELLMDSIQ